MKILLPLAVVAFVIVQSGCSGDSNSPPANPGQPGVASPTPSPSPTNSSIWSQISERTSCATSLTANCVGAYGFTVFNNGTYQVGPASTGLYLLGSLAPGEIDVINQDAISVAAGDLTGGYTCAGTGTSSGDQDNVSVLFTGQNAGDVIYRQFLIGEGSDCYIGDKNAAFQLHEDLNNLMNEFYPIPFPSPAGSPSPTPSSSPTPSPTGTPVQNGNWGGTGVAADVEADNASFDFNCGQGQTDGPLLEAADGTFSQSGSYSSEAGPIVQNDPRVYAATYSGTVNGDQMTLNIQYKNYLGTPITLNFTLTFDQPGTINPICPFD
jgi:hypothetical protein